MLGWWLFWGCFVFVSISACEVVVATARWWCCDGEMGTDLTANGGGGWGLWWWWWCLG